MDIEQIRNNAPEGSTHYREYTGQYFSITNKDWLVWNGKKFIKWQCTRFINIKPL